MHDGWVRMAESARDCRRRPYALRRDADTSDKPALMRYRPHKACATSVAARLTHSSCRNRAADATGNRQIRASWTLSRLSGQRQQSVHTVSNAFETAQRTTRVCLLRPAHPTAVAFSEGNSDPREQRA
ncbi:hypothetical protein CERSUDRAFT_118266 [Gelatoporia subvermispora B]|uniref:Uncharacterized protein n=1 Tax=Ceriporiopsis subvermispora (strain B) TaxID=914234 RepID=M2PC39_CERS8|nr:hypothetical protein CERSUDRAFT_118266 [Gelatoporia subvermispora B]